MIPDKLYVEISGNKDSSVYWIGRTSSVPQSDDSVEYIRKDALLEWLKMKTETAEIVVANSVDRWVTRQVYKQVMNKLNSM